MIGAEDARGTDGPRHGGNLTRLTGASGRSVDDLVDFSANINPLGPPEWLRPVISAHVGSLVHYPDPDCTALVAAIAARHGVAPGEIVVGNGSSEILAFLPRALAAERALVIVPAYGEYAPAAARAGLPVERLVLREAEEFRVDPAVIDAQLKPRDLVFLGQPANPTGRACDPAELRALARRHPEATFVIDEAFADFVEGLDRLFRDRPRNLVVLASLTKFYAVPGLRLGFAVGEPSVAAAVRGLLPPWSVNTLAQAVGCEALRDTDYGERTRRFVTEERDRLACALGDIPHLAPYAGQANFLLVRLSNAPIGATELARRALADGVAVRTCGDFDGLDDRFFRVAVRTADENRRLCDALRRALAEPGARRPATRRRTPAVMLAGTSSHAGKSILTAALCRILLQDGYRVAPFKSQNMSLNSYATRDGGEMGRAQVLQAQACRLEPDVRMNPILLKPNSDTGSQVVVMGQPVGTMEVASYIRFKPRAFEAARAAYDDLAATHDCIVLEGAGSLAEVNLKSHDIVNLAMARHAEAPVLVVGDIDRGGVFASFVGTMEVLSEAERAQVAGFVVNRFRGRRDLLDDALASTRRHTGRPVLGVVPWLAHLGLPEEDSVSFKARRAAETGGRDLEIALVDFPHISNFTDCDALEAEPDITLRIVRSADDLGHPDAVILPGSKSVAPDLAWLRETGLAERLLALARSDATEIVGICGGLQMLGDRITDPHGIESGNTAVDGLGLLPVTTELAAEKTLQAVAATHVESSMPLRGYEIHHGRTQAAHLPAAVLRDDGAVVGFRCPSRRLWGTYLHGIFDADGFRGWFLDGLRARRGLSPLAMARPAYDLEPALDRLAQAVRASLDLPEIYRRMGLP